MLKKVRHLTRPTLARQDAPFRWQGRRRVETGGGTDRTSWGRSPVQWILANGKTPPVWPTSENLNRYIEDFDEPRTMLGEKRVSARGGWAGEKSDFFSILCSRLEQRHQRAVALLARTIDRA
jgi:hypothetical protein